MVGIDLDALKKENEELKAKVVQQATTIAELEKKLNPNASTEPAPATASSQAAQAPTAPSEKVDTKAN